MVTIPVDLVTQLGIICPCRPVEESASSNLVKRGFESLLGHKVETQTKNASHALVMELVYILLLESKFWEFDSPLGYQMEGTASR